MKKYIIFLGLEIFAGISILWFVNKYDIQIIARLLNSFEDGGSGRTKVWEKVILYFQDSTLLKQIFGHGYHAVPNEVKPLNRTILAHSSYLEALYDLGWVGLIWLVLIVIYLCKCIYKMGSEKKPMAPILLFSMVNIILLSLLGYFFDETNIILPIAILWGICLGKYKNLNLK